jgi:hypothetical protein
MGVGYQVSPLHRIVRLDTTDLRKRPVGRGENALLDALGNRPGVQIVDGPVRTQSPTVERIVAWRRGLARRYRGQLDEELTWDERSAYENSEDVGTGDDVILHFTAAVLDEHGMAGLSMIDQRRPNNREMEIAFAEADRRGFGGRFPQFLLGARIWLPFSRNLMIEEPDWNGRVKRYGSVPRLIDELTTLRAGIADANPSVKQSAEPEAQEYSLAAAWQASSTILRLATVASERHLPLWTTG